MAKSGSIACFFHGSLCVKATRFLSFSFVAERGILNISRHKGPLVERKEDFL